MERLKVTIDTINGKHMENVILDCSEPDDIWCYREVRYLVNDSKDLPRTITFRKVKENNNGVIQK